MSLKSAAEIRRYEKDGEQHIGDIVLTNVRFNYTHLETPRPPMAGSSGEGSYETQLILETQEAWEAFYEYFQEVYEKAVVNTWRGRRPQINAMNVPFEGRQVDGDGQPIKFHENAVAIVKTRTSTQPKLYLRMPGEPLREADINGNDLGEFYSGMIGEAVVSLWAYPKGQYSPKDGIKAFINAACKTGVGEPIVTANRDYMEAFGGTGETQDTNVAAFAAPKPTAPKQTAPAAPALDAAPTAAAPTPAAPTPAAPALDAAMSAPTAAPELPTEKPTAKTNLEDLLKKVK